MHQCVESMCGAAWRVRAKTGTLSGIEMSRTFPAKRTSLTMQNRLRRQKPIRCAAMHYTSGGLDPGATLPVCRSMQERGTCLMTVARRFSMTSLHVSQGNRSLDSASSRHKEKCHKEARNNTARIRDVYGFHDRIYPFSICAVLYIRRGCSYKAPCASGTMTLRLRLRSGSVCGDPLSVRQLFADFEVRDAAERRPTQ